MYQFAMRRTMQTLDFTQATMQTFHSVGALCHTANDRGSIARITPNLTNSAIYAVIAILAIAAVFALFTTKGSK